jgi:hypothetical protein
MSISWIDQLLFAVTDLGLKHPTVLPYSRTLKCERLTRTPKCEGIDKEELVQNGSLKELLPHPLYIVKQHTGVAVGAPTAPTTALQSVSRAPVHRDESDARFSVKVAINTN